MRRRSKSPSVGGWPSVDVATLPDKHRWWWRQNLRRCSATVWLKGLSTPGRWPIRRSAVGGVTEVSRLDQDGQRRCSGSNEREQARDAGVAPASGRRWPGRVLGTKTLVDRSDMVGSMAPTSPIGETSALQGPGNMVGELTVWVDVVLKRSKWVPR